MKIDSFEEIEKERSLLFSKYFSFFSDTTYMHQRGVVATVVGNKLEG